MIDNISWEQFNFKVHNPNNFYYRGMTRKALPYIDTLKDTTCYQTIPSKGTFEAYRLKRYLRTPLGYCPALVEIRDIPFTWRRFRLAINVSLPKVLYGNSLQEITAMQLNEIIDAIYVMLMQFGIEVDKEELRNTPNIRRIDFCKNIKIQTPVNQFVSLLTKVSKPRSKTYYSYDESLSWGTKKKRLNVYDKIAETIAKASSNPETPSFKLKNALNSLKATSEINVFRVEQRLYGRQAIMQEVKPFIQRNDLSLKSLFAQDISSYVLSKHWNALTNEAKFKTLLLGEQKVHTIASQMTRIVRKQGERNVNPVHVLYTKLLNEVGEIKANQSIKDTRKPRTIKDYKKKLYAIMEHLPLYDTRLTDYRAITKSLEQGTQYNIPEIQNYFAKI